MTEDGGEGGEGKGKEKEREETAKEQTRRGKRGVIKKEATAGSVLVREARDSRKVPLLSSSSSSSSPPPLPSSMRFAREPPSPLRSLPPREEISGGTGA